VAALERSRQRQHETALTHFEKQSEISERMLEKQSEISERMLETLKREFDSEQQFQQHVIWGAVAEGSFGESLP
jgi:hypothetical protein